MVEPRHGVIRSIFLRLRQADSSSPTEISAVQAVRVSNDLYGNDVASAFELTKGFTRPIQNDSVISPLPAEILKAHCHLVARRKLNLILRRHAKVDNHVRVGDLIQIYIKTSSEKRGSWTSPRQVLKIDADGGFITAAGRAGRSMRAAFEDTRIAPQAESFESQVQLAIDDLEDRLDDLIHDALPVGDAEGSDHSNDGRGNVNETDTATSQLSCDSTEHSSADDHDVADATEFTNGDTGRERPDIGARVEVFWPLDNAFYAGEVKAVNYNGHHTVIPL